MRAEPIPFTKKYKVLDDDDNIWFAGSYKDCRKYIINHAENTLITTNNDNTQHHTS